jgi:hypothetical protein
MKRASSICFVAASMSAFVPISADEKFKGVRREQ